jgi:L-asparagine oxygenase
MTSTISIAESLSLDGYILIRGFEPGNSSLGAFSRIGVVDSVEGLNTIQTLTPKDQKDAPPNTYSGNFGSAEFPLHTDLAHWAVPPRYLALRCIQGASNVATRLLDGRVLLREFGAGVLQMALVQPRRPMKNGKQLLRLLDTTVDVDLLRIRWDSLYLTPATRLANVVFVNICSFLATIKPHEVVLRDRGDTLIIDNWRWLHGRSSTEADSHSRHIDRAYLSCIKLQLDNNHDIQD